MELGELVGSGRSADVYAIDGDRVLRRYRATVDTRREVAVMAYVARHGFQVPDVYPAVGEGRATDLVMRRLSGPTMLRAVIDGEIAPAEVGRVTGRLLRRLHTIPARVSDDPRDRVLHMDLHPDNVMLTPGGPFVIDWCNSLEGPPGLDCAMSAVIIAQVAVDEESELAVPAREMLVALLSELGAAMDYGDGLDRAMATRGANRSLSAREVALIDAAGTLIRELRTG
ncbi:phosphotransferase [Nonomuraea polychroma]|uniref:phosphotransferase n=1 Tax=Nonomuraea polychroma TaxID=46176 RepID=UPI003D8F2E52